MNRIRIASNLKCSMAQALATLLAAMVASMVVSGGARAQSTRRPLTIVVAAAAGAANDLLARTLAAEIKDEAGVIVENKPGGNGVIGAEFVKRAPPDGRTVLAAPSSYVIAAGTGAAMPFDFVADFAPVMHAANLPFYLVVSRAAIDAKDLGEFVRIARERSGQLSYGSAGNASPHHFAAEMLRLRADFAATHVPYRGMALGVPDLLEGRIQFVITGLPAISQAMKGGKLRVLATVEPRRASLHPDIPTFNESGYPGLEMETWLGLVAPAGTPRATVDALYAVFKKALEPASVRERLSAQGLEIIGAPPDRFAARITEDIARFRRIAQAAGIKAD